MIVPGSSSPSTAGRPAHESAPMVDGVKPAIVSAEKMSAAGIFEEELSPGSGVLTPAWPANSGLAVLANFAVVIHRD